MNSIVLAGAALLLGAPALKDPPAKPPTIVGEWTVEASLLGGKDDGLMTRAPIDRIIITSERWIVVRNGQVSAGSEIAVDLKQDPPHLDIGVTEKGPGSKAVFKLDGDTLTVCYVSGGADRPTKVESPLNSNVRLMTLKRIKK